MAKAVKLPSGSWNIRIYDSMLKKQICFTAETKAEVELLAAEYKNGKRQKPSQMTIGEAIDTYIASKSNILSPTTINGYEVLRRNFLAGLCDMRIDKIDTATVQAYINRMVPNYSVKTIYNGYGLLTTVLRKNACKVDFDDISLPKKVKK